MESHRSLLQRR